MKFPNLRFLRQLERITVNHLFSIIIIYFNGSSTSPFAACPVNNKGCEEEAIITLTNRFYVAVRLFSSRSQMTSKCGKNKKVAHEAQPSVSLTFLPHFDVLCDLLLNRRTATWNLFVLYNKKIKIHGKNALLFQISPL